MRIVLAFVICLSLTGQPTTAEAYACNNRDYVNSSGHVVHLGDLREERDR